MTACYPVEIIKPFCLSFSTNALCGVHILIMVRFKSFVCEGQGGIRILKPHLYICRISILISSTLCVPRKIKRSNSCAACPNTWQGYLTQSGGHKTFSLGKTFLHSVAPRLRPKTREEEVREPISTPHSFFKHSFSFARLF